MTKFVYSQPFIVVGAFIVRDGKLLLIQENHYPDAGKWNLPAGKLNVGESPMDAARREAFEEAGIAFTPTALLGIHSVHRKDVPDELRELHIMRIVFVGDSLGDVSLEHGEMEGGVTEIADSKWLLLEEVLALDNAQLRYHDIKDLVRRYQQGITYPLEAIEHIVQL
jgi:ADP-ribose pyrophosphatase YjhB (NUDIX family)